MEQAKTPLSVLHRALELESIGSDEFRSKSLWRPFRARGVFGGQVIGQALASASKTVDSKFQLHSLHCYFVDRGDPSTPIEYFVSRIRDGKSFVSRFVRAIQSGRVIFALMTSFTINDPTTLLKFQCNMPEVPHPDSLPNTEDQYRSLLSSDRINDQMKNLIEKRLSQPFPIEMKFCEGDPLITRKQHLFPRQQIWMRTRGQLSDDPRAHDCVVAYFSDYSLLITTILPFGYPNENLVMIASLDHAMWFHTSFRADEWMLYDMESSVASEGRGLVTGRLFRQDGVLAVTVVQEGLFRWKSKNQTLETSNVIEASSKQFSKL